MPDPTPHLERFDSYQQACREFRLQIPRTFNLAGAICRRHSDATTRIALREVKPGGINTYTFGGLDFLSDKLAMSLAGSGLARGDKVLVMLPPSSAAAVAHLGALKAGGVVIPISPSAEPSLVSQVFAESGAKFVVILEALLDALLSRAFALPAADALYIVRDLRPSSARLDTKDFWTEVDSASSDFNAIDTESHRPAFLFYDVRGDEVVCLAHSHGSLVSQLAAFEMVSDLDLDPGSTWFTGQDWDSVTSVLAFLYPAWWYGCSVVVAAPPGDLFTLIERCQITHAFVGAEDPQRIVQDRTSDVRRSSLRLIVTDAPASDIARDRDDRPLNVSRFYAMTPVSGLA